MNINGFIKANKDKSYIDFPFNDVDGLIFAELSYINFEILFKDKEELVFKDIKLEELTKEVFEGSVDASKNKTMLKRMITSLRYQDIAVRDIKRIFSDKEPNQFYALTLVLPDNTLFISYRGTDTTLIGWKEDALLTYKETIKAQNEALEYANDVLKDKDNKFILGGHSKGGNLAFYAALNVNQDKLANFIKAYSYDGPGFKDGIVDFPNYQEVKDKLFKFLTFNDVIGSFFNNMKKYKVVHSPGILFGGHDPFYWQVLAKTNDFYYAKDVSRASKKYSKRVMNWVESLTYDDRKLATEALFDVFSNNNTIYDLFKNFLKNIIAINRSLEKYSEVDREKLRAIIRRLFGFLFNSNKVKDIDKKQTIMDRELKEKKRKKKSGSRTQKSTRSDSESTERNSDQ